MWSLHIQGLYLLQSENANRRKLRDLFCEILLLITKSKGNWESLHILVIVSGFRYAKRNCNSAPNSWLTVNLWDMWHTDATKTDHSFKKNLTKIRSLSSQLAHCYIYFLRLYFTHCAVVLHSVWLHLSVCCRHVFSLCSFKHSALSVATACVSPNCNEVFILDQIHRPAMCAFMFKAYNKVHFFFYLHMCLMYDEYFIY